MEELNVDGSENSRDKFNALMEDLQTKTDDFMNIICATKTLGKIRVKPISAAAYEKLDAFIASIDDVIKWYESDNSEMKEKICFFSSKVKDVLKESDARMEETEKIIAEQNEKITKMEETSSKMIIDYEEKIKALEEKLETMKDSEIKQEQKCKEFEQKEASSKKLIEEMEVKNNTEMFKVGALTINLKEANDDIHYWKQKFEQVNLYAGNAEMNNRLAELEAQLKSENAKNADHARQHEADNKKIADLEKQLSDATSNFDQKIKTLENEIAELKKTNLQTIISTNNNFVKLKDVIVEGEINYELLKGKVLSVNNLELSNVGGCWYIYFPDVREEKMVELHLNDSFKLHLDGYLFAFGGQNFMHYIHSYSLKSLFLDFYKFSFTDYLKLVESRTIENLELNYVSVESENGVVPLEKMLEYFPNLKELRIYCYGQHICREETASNLLKLPTFENLKLFYLIRCPYEFDLETFGKFMKQHSWAQFRTVIDHFDAKTNITAPDEIIHKHHKARLSILGSWPRNSPKPFMSFFLPENTCSLFQIRY